MGIRRAEKKCLKGIEVFGDWKKGLKEREARRRAEHGDNGTATNCSGALVKAANWNGGDYAVFGDIESELVAGHMC